MSEAILVLGKDGQLGRALASQLGARAMALGRSECDLLDPDYTHKLTALVKIHSLSAVINAAAYTGVDKAEREDKDKAMRINATAVGELAAWCREHNLPLIHYSTDYVFDGSGTTSHRETETPSPVNVYGESKLRGENALQDTGGEYLLFRTSWVYDARGKNFFNTIRRLIREKEELSVVDDQIGAPTYAPHLARATLAALDYAGRQAHFPTGIYHLCNGGETSWCGFANAILAHDKREPDVRCKKINPIPSSAYPLPAKRPLNSRLDCSKAREVLNVALPDWHEGLKECFDSL